MARSCRLLVLFLALPSVLLGLERAFSHAESAPPPPVVPAHPTDAQQYLRRLGISTEPAALLKLLNNHSRTEKDTAVLDQLVRELGDDDFEVRDKATQAIVALGLPALDRLAEAAKDEDLEVRSRAVRCIDDIQKGLNKDAAYCAVSELLRQRAHGATAALLAYLPYADFGAEEAIYFGLEAVAVRDGKVDPVLRAAMTDKVPARRALAALLLARLGGDADRATVRKCLADKNPLVRLRAAQGLLAVHDDAALPALAGLLDGPSVEIAWQAEELLRWAAGSKAPASMVGSGDVKQRRACRTAWDNWLKVNSHLDWDRVARDYRRPGLLFLCAEARLSLIGSSGKPTWQLELAEPVLDAHLLSNGHLLLAEDADTTRIHERDLKGKTIWEYRARGSEDFTCCQRLPNGNTFVVSDENLIEVTPEGAEVFRKDTLEDDFTGDAVRQRTGAIYYLNGPTLIELDAAGKRVRKTKLDGKGRNVAMNNYKLAALSDGGVLLNLLDKNKVQQRGRDGSLVWEAAVPRPSGACMLPSGNVVVATNHQREQRLIELSRQGKTVWEAKLPTRPMTQRVRPCFNLLRVGLDNPRPADFDIDGAAFRTEGLKDPDVTVRRRSAGALADLGAKAASAVPALAITLGDTDAEVRRSCATALAKIGPPAVPALMAAVKAGNAPAADEAASGLGQMKAGVKATIPDLIALLADSKHKLAARAAGAKALGEIGLASPEAIKELLAAFQGNDLPLRCAAGRSLGLLASQPAAVVPALTAALKDPAEAIKTEALHALIHFGPKAEPAIPTLVELLQGKDVLQRVLTAEALGAIGPAAKKAIPVLAALLKNPMTTTDLRAASAQAMLHMGPAAKEAFPAFLEALKDPNLPAELVRTLPDMVWSTLKKDGTPLLVQTLKEGARPSRLAVLATLTRYAPVGRPRGVMPAPHPKELIDAVKEIADKDTDAAMRMTAKRTLFRLQQPGFGR